MSKKTKKSALDQELDLDVIFAYLQKIFLLIIAIVAVWAYFKIYDPQKQMFIKRSNYAYAMIQEEAKRIHRENGFVYDKKNPKYDELCNTLLKKNNKKGGTCEIVPPGMLRRNFTFNKYPIEIYGMERPPVIVEGMTVKEIMVDVDGEAKGKNEIGVDRVPIRIYSDGIMAGRLSPVNCSPTSLKDWEIHYSAICAGSPDIDFLQTNIPFGYNITQVGGPEGKSRLLNRNVPFLRADCSAFGGEFLSPYEYCDKRQYHWLSACYDEYPCSIDLAKEKY